MRYAADRIDDKIKFTDDALQTILNVPRVFLPLVLRGCVDWAKENNVQLINAEHMKIINDKRAKEKTLRTAGIQRMNERKAKTGQDSGEEDCMKVEIYSRKAIEAMIEGDFPRNTAVVSFYSPKTSRRGDYAPVDYRGRPERLFYMCAHDVDIDALADFGLTYDTYMPDAQELAGFIVKAATDGLDMICQCDYGQSRSAACAAAILEHFFGTGIRIFADYRYYPNQLVFNKIYEALGEYSGRKKEE